MIYNLTNCNLNFNKSIRVQRSPLIVNVLRLIEDTGSECFDLTIDPLLSLKIQGWEAKMRSLGTGILFYSV